MKRLMTSAYCGVIGAPTAIAVLTAVLVAVDGMFFVQSRIAMNDVYAGLFIVAAYTLFAAVWTGWWRWRWAWLVALPVVGVLLGLALASKWVGLYAIAGIGILILGRSALGRILLILSLIGGTVVLGNIALTALPANATTSGPNYMFVIVMVGMTLAAVLHAVLRPVAWTDDETRLAIEEARSPARPVWGSCCSSAPSPRVSPRRPTPSARSASSRSRSRRP